jgi:hypothetical protein
MPFANGSRKVFKTWRTPSGGVFAAASGMKGRRDTREKLIQQEVAAAKASTRHAFP